MNAELTGEVSRFVRIQAAAADRITDIDRAGLGVVAWVIRASVDTLASTTSASAAYGTVRRRLVEAAAVGWVAQVVRALVPIVAARASAAVDGYAPAY